MKRIGKTREAWLEDATRELRAGLFKRSGYEVPKLSVSVGFPWASRSSKAIGQHWNPSASANKRGAIFISPTIGDAIEALATLIHELVHAAVGTQAGHGPLFRKCALAVGLEGKMRATVAGETLKVELKTLIQKIGSYPHAQLNPSQLSRKKQSTRLIKMECEECGYIARTTRKYLEVRGALLCPCNMEAMRYGETIGADLEEAG